MGFRFRKSVNVAPGVKLNINKKSAGVSVGTKGAHYTVNSKGQRTSTVGIPGTGVSHSTTKGSKVKSKGSSMGCAGFIALFIPFISIMAGLQYLREHPAVGITVAVILVLAVIVAVLLFFKKKNKNSTEESLDNSPNESTTETTDNKIHAQLIDCYSEERQQILRKIYRNKYSEDFKIELSFEPIVENNEDLIKVFVNDEIIGFVDKDNTKKLLPVLSKIENCLLDVRNRTDEGENYHVASLNMTFKK